MPLTKPSPTKHEDHRSTSSSLCPSALNFRERKSSQRWTTECMLCSHLQTRHATSVQSIFQRTPWINLKMGKELWLLQFRIDIVTERFFHLGRSAKTAHFFGTIPDKSFFLPAHNEQMKSQQLRAAWKSDHIKNIFVLSRWMGEQSFRNNIGIERVKTSWSPGKE